MKTYFTYHFATYVELNINNTQTIRSQPFNRDRPFLRNCIAKKLDLTFFNHCLGLVDLRHDINTPMESLSMQYRC